MRKRFKFPLTFIFMIMLSCVVIYGSYYIFYKVNNEEVIVLGDVTVSYKSTNEITKSNYEDILFTVMNNGSKDESYYIFFDGVESQKDIEYNLSYNGEVIKNGILKNENILEDVYLKPGEIHEYKLDLMYTEGFLSAEVKVNKIIKSESNFADLIFDSNDVKEESITKVGSELSTLDEGLIKSKDDSGDTYYFRGSTQNNYVSFADFTWRIVRINGDGSVKLVLDNLIDLSSAYYSDIDYINFKDSLVHTTLNTWYDNYLVYYSDVIVNGKFCNDNSVVDSLNNVLAPNNRAKINGMAVFNCLGDSVSSKIGLLTVDEVLFAGGVYNESNASYYLYNSDIKTEYYLMSGSEIYTNSYYPFTVNANGSVEDETDGDLIRGVRPTINIIKSVKVTGLGTIDEPYILSIN